MNQYKVVYRWSDREYSTVMPARTATYAIWLAEMQIMPGARIIGVEPIHG